MADPFWRAEKKRESGRLPPIIAIANSRMISPRERARNLGNLRAKMTTPMMKNATRIFLSVVKTNGSAWETANLLTKFAIPEKIAVASANCTPYLKFDLMEISNHVRRGLFDR